MRRRKNKKKKKLFLYLLILLLIVAFVFGGLYLFKNKGNVIKEKEVTLADIQEHYGAFVISTKDSSLYDKDNKKIGTLKKDAILALEEIELTKDTKYFKLMGTEAYVYFSGVKGTSYKENLRYKKYIPFNESIVTNPKTSFYENGKLLYTINVSFEFPIVIKDDDGYYVEYNNKLLLVKKEDVASTKENNNTELGHTDSIQVFCYHSFYNEGNQGNCTSEICLSNKELEAQTTFLHDDGWFTTTMKELEMFIDGKVQLPEHTVSLTIDDGYLAEIGLEIFDKYELNVTLFLITSSYTPDNFLNSDYIEFHSHSDNLHKQGDCPNGQGGGIQCLDKQVLLDDLKKSREKLNGTTVFCYPFYEYNDYSIEVLKEAGFTMAFGASTEEGKTKVYKGSNKFRLPRDTIVSWNDVAYMKKVLNK